jgi:hypothetical protein
MRYLLAGVALVAVEIAVVAYWYTSEAWDCGVHCSTSQQASGWIGLVLPILVLGVIVVAIVRKLRGSHNGELGQDT